MLQIARGLLCVLHWLILAANVFFLQNLAYSEDSVELPGLFCPVPEDTFSINDFRNIYGGSFCIRLESARLASAGVSASSFCR